MISPEGLWKIHVNKGKWIHGFSLQLSCEKGFVKGKHWGLETWTLSLHSEMGCGALQGLTAAAVCVIKVLREKILPPWPLTKDSPALCNSEVSLFWTTVPRRTFQQTHEYESCMFYTPSACSCWSGDCAIWCIIILISQWYFLSLHLCDPAPLKASGPAPFTPCLLALSSAGQEHL